VTQENSKYIKNILVKTKHPVGKEVHSSYMRAIEQLTRSVPGEKMIKLFP
jgi:hypothetical protein